MEAERLTGLVSTRILQLNWQIRIGGRRAISFSPIFAPINESFSIARFCGFYGIWYRDPAMQSFVENLTAMRGISMRAIEKSKLIQNEDIGKHIARRFDHADFENERRWL
jgi:hypothetical protein